MLGMTQPLLPSSKQQECDFLSSCHLSNNFSGPKQQFSQFIQQLNVSAQSAHLRTETDTEGKITKLTQVSNMLSKGEAFAVQKNINFKQHQLQITNSYKFKQNVREMNNFALALNKTIQPHDPFMSLKYKQAALKPKQVKARKPTSSQQEMDRFLEKRGIDFPTGHYKNSATVSFGWSSSQNIPLKQVLDRMQQPGGHQHLISQLTLS